MATTAPAEAEPLPEPDPLPEPEPLPEPLAEPAEADDNGEEGNDSCDDDLLNPREAARDDWASAMDGMRRRKQELRAGGHRANGPGGHQDEYDDDDYDDDDWDARERAMRSPRSSRWYKHCIIALVSILLLGCVQLWLWLNPTPLSCELELVRPQKFKVDVTDFFAPKVSAALQLVLSVRNSNMLRAMLLEECKLVAFEVSTGLRLGTTEQKSLVVSPFSSTKVTVNLPQLAGSLPQPEQRRLASDFLAKKALLLTIVATATSRLPVKGSKSSSVSSNSTRTVDLSTLLKEPFFQRNPPPPPPPDAEGAAKAHDVPV